MIIINYPLGGIGNRLVLFSHFIALAIQYNLSVMYFGFTAYGHHFQSTHDNLFCYYPSQSSLYLKESYRQALLKHWCKFIPSVSQGLSLLPGIGSYTPWRDELDVLMNEDWVNRYVRKNKILFVNGWYYRNSNLLIQHADKIRAFFTPLDQYTDNIRNIINPARQNYDILVGVHIRLGNYKTHIEGCYYYSIEQYVDWMHQICALFPDQQVAFLVCSNENLVLENFDKLTVFFGTQHIIEDLYAMAQCDYLIGPPSTYGLWASFYGSVPYHDIKDPLKPITLKAFYTRSI